MAAHSQAPDGDFLPYIVLDFSSFGTPIDSRAAALSLLRPLAAGGVRGQGIEANLQRTLLQALLEQGLVGEGSRFGLRPVAHQQAGEAMLKVLPSARPDVAAAYRQPGLGSTDLLRMLHAAGLLARGNLSGKQAIFYSARLHWLKPYGKRPAPPAQPARLVPLPSGPVHSPPAAQHAARQPSAGGTVQVTLQPPRGSGKPRVSPANAISMLKYKLTRGFTGPAPKSQLLQLAVGCLLGEGLEKVDTLAFRQHPVSLKAARKALEQQLHSKSPAVQACYRAQFGGSVLTVLQAPELAGLVQLQGMPAAAENGWQQAGGSEQGRVQLLLVAPRAGLGAAVVARQPVAAGPTQQAAAQPAAETDEAEFEGWSFSADEAETAGATAAYAPPPPVPLPQPEAPALAAAAQPPPAAPAVAAAPGQVTVRAISSEHAAGAAVAALLSAPGGRIGMACKHSHPGSDPGALVISLFAPGPASSGGGSGGSSAGSGGTCHVFDLAAMPPADRKAAVRLLAAVLENPQLIKVLHDCRPATQVLFDFPGRSINLQGVIDTQVAHGLAQFLALLGTNQAAEGVDEPVPAQDLLVLHRVPQPSLGGGAAPHAMHAAAAAAPLLALAAALETSLGPVASARLPALSRAFSRWDLDLAAFTAAARPPRQWLAHLLELAPLCV